jgi:hypothetical protein
MIVRTVVGQQGDGWRSGRAAQEQQQEKSKKQTQIIFHGYSSVKNPVRFGGRRRRPRPNVFALFVIAFADEPSALRHDF